MEEEMITQEEEMVTNINTEKKKDECMELKNIKYKTMLMNGTTFKETKSSNNLSHLEKFLEDEKNNNQNEPWCKLDKTVKTVKLIDYVEEYKKTNDLSEEESTKMICFLKDCLDRKKLQRVKDVVYDKTNGTVKEIPALQYTKSNKHFTLKNMDKRVSTLKSLTPKKIQGTVKNKLKIKTNTIENKNDSASDDED
jgi:hypothetical protein